MITEAVRVGRGGRAHRHMGCMVGGLEQRHML